MIRTTRKDWEDQGVIIAACSALFLRFLWQMSEHIDVPSASLVLRELCALFALPLSAYFSALAVIRFASRMAPSVAWWIRGSLRWTFWWAVRLAIAASAGGIVASFIPGISGELLMKSTIALPSIYLIRQALKDYRSARHRFGSLARAERAMYPKD